MASAYLVKRYKQMGIAPMGDKGTYLQAFTFIMEKKLTGDNHLSINSQPLQLNDEYFPLNIASSGKVKASWVDVGYGISAASLGYDDYAEKNNLSGKVFVMECSTPDGDNPHSSFAPISDLVTKINLARSKGAVAVIFTNSKPNADDLHAHLEINAPGLRTAGRFCSL